MSFCDNFSFINLYLFDSIFPGTVRIDKLHKFIEGIYVHSNGIMRKNVTSLKRCILGKSAQSLKIFLHFMAAFHNFDFKIKTVKQQGLFSPF